MTGNILNSILALDSCVVIATIKSPKVARAVFEFFRGNKMVVLQDIVLGEVSKILQFSKEEIVEKIRSILRREVKVFATTESIRKEAVRYETQYGICHHPDSKILAATKSSSWILLTMDRKMIQTAEFEGITVFNPMSAGGQ